MAIKKTSLSVSRKVWQRRACPQATPNKSPRNAEICIFPLTVNIFIKRRRSRRQKSKRKPTGNENQQAILLNYNSFNEPECFGLVEWQSKLMSAAWQSITRALPTQIRNANRRGDSERKCLKLWVTCGDLFGIWADLSLLIVVNNRCRWFSRLTRSVWPESPKRLSQITNEFNVDVIT